VAASVLLNNGVRREVTPKAGVIFDWRWYPGLRLLEWFCDGILTKHADDVQYGVFSMRL
jgi:hypothetical protein